MAKVKFKKNGGLCSNCKQLVEKTLAERIHKCSCGLTIDRDLNAAINILRIGRDSLEAKLPRSSIL
jgi:putative transposase